MKDSERSRLLDDEEFERLNPNKLSEIIIGAPHKILKEDSLPEFFYPDCPKVDDLFLEAKHSESISNELKKAFANKTLIDLGAGRYATGLLLADYFGAKNYIGVEPVYSITPEINLVHEIARKRIEGEIRNCERIHLSKADMRSFMKGMPSKCNDLTILLSGIDKFILGNIVSPINKDEQVKNDERKKYQNELKREFARVLASGERVVSWDSYSFCDKSDFEIKFCSYGRSILLINQRR